MQQIEKFCVTCKYVTCKRHFNVVAGVDEAVFNFTDASLLKAAF